MSFLIQQNNSNALLKQAARELLRHLVRSNCSLNSKEWIAVTQFIASSSSGYWLDRLTHQSHAKTRIYKYKLLLLKQCFCKSLRLRLFQTLLPHMFKYNAQNFSRLIIVSHISSSSKMIISIDKHVPIFNESEFHSKDMLYIPNIPQ